MRNLGIFPFKPWPTHLFYPSPSCFFHLPFCRLSLSAHLPTPPLHPPLGCLHTTNGLLRTTGFVFLHATSGYTYIYDYYANSCLINEYIKNILDACFTLYYLNGRFTAFYHHASGCLTPCKQTKFSEPGSWVTDFSLFESPFSLLHWVTCSLGLIVDWILFLSLFLLLLLYCLYCFYF